MNRPINSTLLPSLAAVAGGKLTVIVGNVHGSFPILQTHNNSARPAPFVAERKRVVFLRLNLDQRTSITLGSFSIHDFTDTGERSALWRTMLSRPMKSYLVKWACFTSRFHSSRTIP